MRATGSRHAYAMQGASGSGKSSLLKAGVLPRLRRERGWFVLRAFRPGADPLLNFAEAIAHTAEDAGVPLKTGDIRRTLTETARNHQDQRATLNRIIVPLLQRADKPGSMVLIPMDQSEELARAEGESADLLGAYVRGRSRLRRR